MCQGEAGGLIGFRKHNEVSLCTMYVQGTYTKFKNKDARYVSLYWWSWYKKIQENIVNMRTIEWPFLYFIYCKYLPVHLPDPEADCTIFNGCNNSWWLMMVIPKIFHRIFSTKYFFTGNFPPNIFLTFPLKCFYQNLHQEMFP